MSQSKKLDIYSHFSNSYDQCHYCERSGSSNSTNNGYGCSKSMVLEGTTTD
uniref:Uncharacterized protein n=1 Tax=Arion vulgaris TaxID=1028688 RepID=A0A0B7ALA7_9EUPU